MNPMTIEKLQYNELKDIVKSYCVSSLGKAMLDKLAPSTSMSTVLVRLNETTEARAILDTESHVPLLGISNIEFLMDKLAKGMVLDPVELIAISDFLHGCRKMRQFMLGKSFYAPNLSAYANSMSEFPDIEDRINVTIKNNRVDSGASKELKRIRKHIDLTETKIEEQLQKFLKSSTNKPYIQEFFISNKNGRFTIPIKASFKNQVAGSIVEASSKGSTVFIEPATVARHSAELASLKIEETLEELQILSELSEIIFQQQHSIMINIDLISQYDMIFAKGKFSRSVGGIAPKVNDHGFIKLIECKHPLLPKNAVPLSFEIGDSYRSLIITGPNAGGKTVVLKTIGLTTLAAMSGFHIAAQPGTEIAIFEKIFVDIGDNQSIENALSTFSSHMKNISDIMQIANNKSLLLFDEIGSGTEPNEGAALAIAILEEFYYMGCITVASTHYGEIKQFSEMHDDFMNAAMLFNQETLEPLYQLMIGRSGESNALWISQKMKLKEVVLERAKQYMTTKDYRIARVHSSKIRKAKTVETTNAMQEVISYSVGDRVRLLEHDNEFAIVYKEPNSSQQVVVLYKGEFIQVPARRIRLELPANELYPEGYDLNQLFVSFKDRKFQHDMERGSKNALRKIQKEMRNQRKL